jgi:protoheme IX farnesyltransferase
MPADGTRQTDDIRRELGLALKLTEKSAIFPACESGSKRLLLESPSASMTTAKPHAPASHDQRIVTLSSSYAVPRLGDLLQLTKPTIMIMVLVTGAAAVCMEGSLLASPGMALLLLAGLYLSGGSANALNQYFERGIDSQMERTRHRRPLPLHRLSPRAALWFAATVGVLGVAIFAAFFNALAALLALGTILFYGFFYTLYLKPRTHLNIVIGGAAGAMAPPIAWAAATGTVAPVAWLLAAIIFIWTPPHFWALALYRKNDYIKVGLPMLPVIKGDRTTLNQIVVYTILMVVASLAVLFFDASWTYAVSASLLGGVFIHRALHARRAPSAKAERGLFGYSIIYLLALFCTVIVEGLI